MNTDPIADMFTRIRNAGMRRQREVMMTASKFKVSIAEVLKKEGFILNYMTSGDGAKKEMKVVLKYHHGQPVISHISRVSKPGLRQYFNKDDLPSVHGGLGIAIVTTSKGVMTDHQARRQGQGGEVIGFVH